MTKKWKHLKAKMPVQRQLINSLRSQTFLAIHDKWTNVVIFSLERKGCEVVVNGETEIFTNEDDAQSFVEGLQYQGILREFKPQ